MSVIGTHANTHIGFSAREREMEEDGTHTRVRLNPPTLRMIKKSGEEREGEK